MERVPVMSRDWQDERWIKLYTRDEPEWMVVHWKWRGLFDEILKHLDPAGMMRLGKAGRKAIAAALHASWDAELEEGVKILEEDGAIRFLNNETVLLVPNFVEAQEAKQSDKARQRKRRDRVKAMGETTSHPEVAYFIRAGDKIKIGTSTNLHVRKKRMKTDNPENLELLGFEFVSRDVTGATLHQKFSKLHLRGEWFKLDKEILQYCCNLSRDVTTLVTNCDSGRHVESKPCDSGRHVEREEREREKETGFEKPDVLSSDLTEREVLGQDPERQIHAHYLVGWKTHVGGKRPPVLDNKRREAIRGRLDEGFSADDLKRACDGLWLSEWHMANKRWGLEVVCRDAAQVEKFIAEVDGDNVRSWEWDPERRPEKPKEVGTGVPMPDEFRDALRDVFGGRSISAKRKELSKRKEKSDGDRAQE
jgi:hypothetical protein